MLGDHLRQQRALGPLAGLDHGGDFAAQRGIVEHHQVDVEQRALFRAQLVRQLGEQARMSARTPSMAVLNSPSSAVMSVMVLSGTTSRSAGGNITTAVPTAAPGEPGTPMNCFLDALALTAQATDRTGGLGVGDNAGELAGSWSRGRLLHLHRTGDVLFC